MGILSVLGRKPVVIEEPEPLEEPIDPDTIPNGPYMAVMEPDIAGISSFRLQFFARAGRAEDFIATLRPDVRRGTHAFWAMHERPQPQEDTHIEALVLVRTDPNSDVVYVVSFLDIESANSFTRFEVKRGLALENVLIYWAAFAQVREELDSISILPKTAPPVLDGNQPAIEEPGRVIAEAEVAVDTYMERTESIVPELSAPQAEDSTVIAEPAVEVLTPEPEIESTIPEFSASQAGDDVPLAEPAAEVLAPEPEIESIIPEFSVPQAEDNVALTEPPFEVLTPEPDADSKTPESLPNPIDEQETDADEAALDQAYVFRHEEHMPSLLQEPIEAIATTIYEPHAAAEPGAGENECYADASETAITMGSVESAPVVSGVPEEDQQSSTVAIAEISLGHSLIDEGAAAGMIVESRAVPGPVISYGGDEEVELRPAFAAARSAEVPSGHSEPVAQPLGAIVASGTAPAPQVNAPVQQDAARQTKGFNIEDEVGRLLKNRRWDRRESPFDGFNSPPGRF